jgi:diguanylate cyclase (GGDEF)-like protein
MSEITSMERVLKSLSFQEPDRVPLFLLLTMHGAKELGMTIREYFSSAENVVRGQILLRRKYDNDCYFPFFYAGREIEALGGDVVYSEDGPPNAGEPIIKKVEDIERLAMPDPRTVRPLQSVLKAINDSCGHEVGDLVLKEVTRIVEDNIRESDVFGRFGGDEFIILFPGCDLKSTLGVLDRIRVAVGKIKEPSLKGRELSLSFGLTTTREGTGSFEELVALADSALYEAKNSGRNTIKSI